jgi:trk system potassium uptake protein
MPTTSPNCTTMRITPILYLLGWSLLGLGLLMSAPAALGLWHQEVDSEHFVLSTAITAGLGIVLLLGTRGADIQIYPRQTFLLTSLVWVSAGTFGALPLMLIGHITFTDAFFEAMSGITTTGSTVLVGLDAMPRSILLWRSLLQWVGGLGFILMGVAILPFLGVGGMRLFRSESSDWSEKSMPRIRSVALSIFGVYVGLTVAAGCAYALAGMTLFDAVNHAMTTVATGGYSTSDASFGHFVAPAIHWVAAVFMLLGALPFVVYVQMLRGDPGAVLRDQQITGFLRFVTVVVLALSLWLAWEHDVAPLEALRLVAFNVISVITTTGYASVDYTLWGPFAVVVFFYLMFVGGCSGSTSGAIKFFRSQIALRVLSRQMLTLVHPSGVFHLEYNGRVLSQDIVRSVVAFSFAFFSTIAVLALWLSFCGLDFLTSLSASVTAVTNVGPGLGDIVGPAGNFSTLPAAAKWALSFGMLLGRLEIMTLLVLFTRHFWRS